MGMIREAHDIGTRGELVVIGSTGMLVIGVAVRKFDKMVLAMANAQTMVSSCH